jgi:cytochrome c oxidase subunit II
MTRRSLLGPERVRSARRVARRWRAGLLVPLALAVAACAEDAPLDTLEPQGPESRTIQDLVGPVFLIAGIVFVLVQGGVLFVAWKFRQRKDDDGSLPGQLHGNTKLEIGWTVLPALLLVGVGIASVLTLLDLEEHPEGAMEVTVVGQQWWWEYRYDVDGDGTDDIVTANDLVIPAGEPVSLSIQSRDVIHSFWIPALNGKRDAVPGREHPLLIEADAPGVYRGQCTEFCGLSHAYMRMRVVALEPADYEAWQENQLEGAEVPDDELAQAGQARFQSTCSACHVIKGEGGNEELREEEGIEGAALVSGAAPDLTHFATRGAFAGAIFDLWDDTDGNGEVDIDEIGGDDDVFNVADLEAWLRDPPAEKPMAAGQSRGMPDLDLTDQAIDELVAYLRTLE